MKVNYLFPNKFKKIGWFILIPSAIFGLITLILDYHPGFFTLKVPSVFIDEVIVEGKVVDDRFFGIVINNILNEILGVVVIIGSLFVAFSREKLEDEYILKIRLESLVWSVYVNYGILLFSFLFIFGFSFLWVMIFNMFTVLLFFIIRFNWQISKLKKSVNNEE